MENRKLIISFYIVASIVIWFLSRSLFHWLHISFYQIRRVPYFSVLREAMPVLLGGLLFIVLLKHALANRNLDEVVSELKKVTWPNRTDVFRSTTVVLVCILVASFILATFDLVWGKVIGYLLKG